MTAAPPPLLGISGGRARLSPEPRARTAEPEASRIIGRNRPTGTRRNGRECKPRETPTDGRTDRGRTDEDDPDGGYLPLRRVRVRPSVRWTPKKNPVPV